MTFPGRDILFFRQEEEERESGERGSAVTFLNSFFSALPSFLPSFLVFELLRDDRYGDWRSSDSFFSSSLSLFLGDTMFMAEIREEIFFFFRLFWVWGRGDFGIGIVGDRILRVVLTARLISPCPISEELSKEN